jgi:hypothetical protein
VAVELVYRAGSHEEACQRVLAAEGIAQHLCTVQLPAAWFAGVMWVHLRGGAE